MMYKTLSRSLYLSIVLTLSMSHICPVEAQSGGACQPVSNKKANGISVGRPKVFDNRTLTLMLENLSNSLQNMHFFNRDALAAAFNFLQGSRSSEVVSNFSITPVPLPSLHQESTRNSGIVNSAGTPLPDTTVDKTTSDRAAVTPQAPPLDSPPGFQGFNPTFGQNPSDLLNDQVNLTYQIFNLRMLLERSLSDRLLDDHLPRRQAVLGFNVTLDPPRTTNDAVAVVEITLNLDDNCNKQDCLSLVSLMPQEKTYNAAALSTKSNSFGGAAVVNMFQVGYSERRRGQIFYLYRDNDTVSYERMDRENPRQVVFGWMFRPVLGRRSVSPGLRQLFAIVSLPSNDDIKKEPDDVTQKMPRPTSLKASIRTYWKKYDKDTMTSFEEQDTNRAGRFKNVFSLGLTKPELFDSRYTNAAEYCDVKVFPTEDYQSDLSPQLTGLSWKLIGSKSVIISAQGNNFFTGTQVIIGDKTYASTADGLIIKSNQAFDLTTGLDSLISGTGSIIGRYGSAVHLFSAVDSSVPSNGIRILDGIVSPPAAGNRPLEIRLMNRQVEYVPDTSKATGQRAVYKYPPERTWGKPVITINGNLVPLPYNFDIDEAEGVATLHTNVPESFLNKGGGLLRVSYPFLPEQWTATYLIPDPIQDFQLTRLSNQSILIHTTDKLGFAGDPRNPRPPSPPTDYCWTVIAGDNPPISLSTETCNVIGTGAQQSSAQKGGKTPGNGKTPPEPSSTKVSTHAVVLHLGADLPEKIILVAPYGAVFPLDVPKLSPPPPAPSKAKELNQYDALWIEVPVKDVASVSLVEANQVSLKYRKPSAGEDGTPPKSIQVLVTREITAKPGDVDITVSNKGGDILGGIRLHISPIPDKGDKQ